MWEYLVLAQSEENFNLLWAVISKNASTVTVVTPGSTPVEQVAEHVAGELEKPIEEVIRGQHELTRLGRIELTPAVHDSNPDGSIVEKTPATYLKGDPGDAYAAIIHLYRPARPEEIAGANMYGVGVYKRGENKEVLPIAPLVEKWRGWQGGSFQ